MKAIMKSIRPQHFCNVLNLIKKLEISTTASKEWKDYLSGKTDKKPASIEVFCYVTKSTNDKLMRMSFVNVDTKVKEERFVILHEDCHGKELNGKVVAKFTLKEVEKINAYSILDTLYETKNQNIKQEELLKLSCLTYQELNAYLKHKIGYAWHIDNLVIFDKPKEIKEFKQEYNYFLKNKTCSGCTRPNCDSDHCLVTKPLTRAPQSWCYVEV